MIASGSKYKRSRSATAGVLGIGVSAGLADGVGSCGWYEIGGGVVCFDVMCWRVVVCFYVL